MIPKDMPNQDRELLEEHMYQKILEARNELQRLGFSRRFVIEPLSEVLVALTAEMQVRRDKRYKD